MQSLQPSPPQRADRLRDFRLELRAEAPGLTRVSLSGELDLSTAPHLADALAKALDGSTVVILDLSELTFMDSAGLHVIRAARARLAQANCRLVLVPGSRQVQRIFEITRTTSELEFISGRKARELTPV